MDGDHRFRIGAWVAYKSVRLVLDLSSSGGHVAAESSSRNVAASQPMPLSTQAEKMMLEKHQQKVLSSVTKEVAKEHIWTVHGRDYDLREFVDRHPGGKEAIELGRGRDCTALFESYHPFTEQHHVVLQKYHVHSKIDAGTKKSSTKEEIPSAVHDPFYETLKARAAESLKKQGIDPNIDRASTIPRTAYYIFIFCCLVTAARSHVRGNVLGSFLFAVFGWLIGALGHDGGTLQYLVAPLSTIFPCGAFRFCAIQSCGSISTLMLTTLIPMISTVTQMSITSLPFSVFIASSATRRDMACSAIAHLSFLRTPSLSLAHASRSLLACSKMERSMAWWNLPTARGHFVPS